VADVSGSKAGFVCENVDYVGWHPVSPTKRGMLVADARGGYSYQDGGPPPLTVADVNAILDELVKAAAASGATTDDDNRSMSRFDVLEPVSAVPLKSPEPSNLLINYRDAPSNL
jgi:hypothetical protein